MSGTVSSKRKMFWLAVWVLVIALYALPGLAKDYKPVYHPELDISRVTGSIEIDGYLDDPGWRDAAKAGNFAEHNPGDQTEPEVNTTPISMSGGFAMMIPPRSGHRSVSATRSSRVTM